jgi:hypothetical protein
MTDYFIGDRVSAWGTWQGPGPDGPAHNGTAADVAARCFDDFSNLPPDSRWDRAIHLKRFQGDYSQWIPADNGQLSRAQRQGPGVFPMEQLRWCEFWLYTVAVAPTSSDDFHMCWEIHTPSANPGGIVTYNFGESPQQQMFRQWVGPGSFTEAYRGKTPNVNGEWHWICIGYRPSVGSTGAVVFKRDAATVFSQSNYQSTTQDGTHYPEIGFYTYWSTQGNDDCLIAGLRVTDVEPMYPGGAGGGGGSGSGGGTPAVDATSPVDGGSYVGTLDYSITVTGAPAGAKLYRGLGASGIQPATQPLILAGGDQVVTGSLDLTPLTASRVDGWYAVLYNSADQLLASDNFNVNIAPPATPPSGSGPVPIAVSVQSDTSVTAAANLADPNVLVTDYEWARFDLPREYEVRRARENGTGRWLRFDSGLGGYVYDPSAVSPLD